MTENQIRLATLDAKEARWELLDRATSTRRRLLEADFVPVPVDGKRPAIAEWQNLNPPSAEEIKQWIKACPSATNTGVLCTQTPAIDIDVLDRGVADEFHKLAVRLAGDSPLLVRFGRAPKRAILFRTDRPFKKLATPVFISPDGQTHHVEVLCDGQQLVVAGKHPETQKKYDWPQGEPGYIKHSKLPVLTEKEARLFIADAAQLMRDYDWQEQSKLKANGKGSEHRQRVGSTDRPVPIRERQYAKAALEGSAAELASITEGERNNRLNACAFRMGRMIARGWIKSADVGDALWGACESNKLVQDDGPDAVQKTLASGIRAGLEKPHPDLSDRVGDSRRPNGSDEIHDRIVSGDQAPSTTEGKPKFEPGTGDPEAKVSKRGWDWREDAISLSDLQSKAFDPIHYILPGIIPEGLTLLVGRPKLGKSWLAFDLGIAVAGGRYILGTLKPVEGDVLYLALEDNQRRLQRRAGKLLTTLGGKWPERLTIVTKWRPTDEGCIEAIEEWCKSVKRPTLVIVDTLQKIRPFAEAKSPYTADYRALTGLQELAGRFPGLGIVVNHHDRKMAADDVFDTVSGTLGLNGAADTILIISRRAGEVTLHVDGRDVEKAEHAIEFNRATCRWTLLGSAADVHQSDQRARILRALEGAGEGLAVGEILGAARLVSRNAADSLLFDMLKDGEIERVKRGVYGLPGTLAKLDGKIGKKARSGLTPWKDHEDMPRSVDLADLADGAQETRRHPGAPDRTDSRLTPSQRLAVDRAIQRSEATRSGAGETARKCGA
jgi:hypothetical protein